MMRRLLFTLGFLVAFTGVVEAQQEILRSDGRRTQVDTYLRALKTLHLPYGPTPTFDGGLEKEGSIFYSTSDNSLYVWDGSVWVQVAPDTDLSNYYTKPQTDSLLTYYATVQELNNGLALKVDKTTTINGYALSGNITLTAADVGALTKALADTYYKDINWVPAWEDITNKPSTFAPSPHTHPISQVTGLQDALDAKQATITGAASTITSADLTASRALISTPTGKVAVSEVTSGELGYVSGVTSGIQSQIDNKVDKSTTITNTGGINIGGSLASGSVSLGVNETYLNNRYLRKDRDDGNGDYTLSVGKLIGDTVNTSRLELVSLATTSEDEYLVVDALGVVSKRTIDQMTFDVANAGGSTQFSIGDADQIRFAGSGDTDVSFNALTNTITINSIPGAGGGGVVTSVFGRQGGVVAEAGDYSTTLVTEGTNLYFTDGRVRAVPLTGFSTSTSPITATDNVLQALGKAQGQINNRALASRELEVSGTAGRIIVSGGAQNLTQDREWIVDLVASGVSTGTYPKVTVDAYGRVTAGSALVAADIPNLAAGKITSGTFDLARLATGTAAAGYYIDGGTGQWTPLPSTDLTNYYTKIETDDLLDGKYDIPAGTTGQYVRGDGSLAAFPTIPQGTVTSVGISVPSNLLSVTGSPVTSSGTFNVTLPNRAANLVFAGPATGSAASPAFRSLVQNDIPALAISKVTGLQDALDGKEGAFSKGSLVAGSGVTLTGTISNRLVGAGNVTISADIEEVNLIAGTGISITGTYPNKTITNTAPNATHTGDVTGSAALTIANAVVSNAKLANVPTGTIKGRIDSGTGSPTDLTPAQVRTLINVENGATANQTDAYLLNRDNHTGTQAISTITNLSTELGNKESLSNKATNFTTVDNVKYPTTQAVVNYVASQAPAAQTLTQPDLGQIGITGGNVVDINSLTLRQEDWNSEAGRRYGYFNRSGVGSPPGASIAHGINMPHSLTSDEYFTNLAFRNNRGWFQSMEAGVLQPWLEIATLDKTVNTSGNQTGIAGNKTWTGVQTIASASSGLGYLLSLQRNSGTLGLGNGTNQAGQFVGYINSIASGQSAGSLNIIAQGSDTYSSAAVAISGRNAVGTGATTGGNIFKVQNYTTDLLNINYQGAITLPNLSGTGNGIVGVTSTGQLTRRPESDVIQTLSLGAAAGNIAISGGNSVSLTSINQSSTTTSLNGWAATLPVGMHIILNAAGSSGFPSLTGAGFYHKRNTGNNVSGAFGILRGVLLDKLHYVLGTSSSESTHQLYTFASEEWANAQGWLKSADIGNGTLSLDTGTGLTGTASFAANQSGNATFTVGIDSGYKLPTTTEWANLLTLGETSSTAYRGDRGKTAYDYSQIGHLPLAGGTVTGQIKRNGDAVSGDDLPRLSQVESLISSIDLDDYIKSGDNISSLTNNVGYIVSGTNSDQVRTNSQLDSRYLQTESDPTVGSHIKAISTGDISLWNSKLSSVVGGSRITIDATDPYNPIINAGSQSITLTGDVLGSGADTITTTIADSAVVSNKIRDLAVTTNKIGDLAVTNDKVASSAINTTNIVDTAVTTDKIGGQAVTTAKLADTAVTFSKIQNIDRGYLIGLGGGGTNTWQPLTGLGITNGYSGNWGEFVQYNTNGSASYAGNLYRSLASGNEGNRPDISPSWWQLVKTNFYGYFNYAVSYPTNASVSTGGNNFWTTSAPISGISPSDTPVNTPGAPSQVKIGEGLYMSGSDVDGWVLKAAAASSIQGTITGGTNVTITGLGTQAQPYVINSSGGGGGGGTVNLSAGSNIGITGSGTSGDPYVISNTYSLPIASSSVLGGVKQGSGVTISGDGTISVSGGGYTLPTATTSVLGGVKLGSNTVQSVAANTPSSEAGKTYPVQLNSSGQAVVNVPWVSGSGGNNFRLRSGTNAYLSNDVTLLAGTNVTISQSGQNITINASGGSGTDLVTAGSSSVGAIRYAGVTKTNGQMYGGVSNPSNSTRLNFDGTLHAYDFVGYGLSDSTKKEDIVRIVDALGKINNLSGYKFKWKEGNENYSGYDYGLLAQEVEKVLPEAVVERNGVKAIRNSNQVISLLLEAVKELDEKVNKMELTQESILGRLQALENEKK